MTEVLPPVRISGPRPVLDPRIHLAREDVVDIGLAGMVAANRYTAPLPMLGAAPRTPIRSAPDAGATAVSELLHGEGFDLFELEGDWGLGRTAHDGYIGWLPLAALLEPSPEPAPPHRITARRAPVFARPDIKAPVLHTLPFGARISAVPTARFLSLSGGGYVHRAHVAPLKGATPLAVARGFMGAPYVWGGRSPEGVDCSGLVQAALAACGLSAPRDSDQQQLALGQTIDPAKAAPGDIAFFPGHVGFIAQDGHLLHANAHWMAVVVEPLADVLDRQGGAQALLGVKRVSA